MIQLIKRFWLQVAFLMLLCACSTPSGGGGGGNSNSTSPANRSNDVTPQPSRNEKPIALVRRGEECYVELTDQPEILLATSEDALKSFTRVANRQDSRGLAELLASGQLFPVKAKTRCVCLEPGIMTYKLRIIEGTNSGQIGFVASEWVHK